MLHALIIAAGLLTLVVTVTPISITPIAAIERLSITFSFPTNGKYSTFAVCRLPFLVLRESEWFCVCREHVKYFRFFCSINLTIQGKLYFIDNQLHASWRLPLAVEWVLNLFNSIYPVDSMHQSARYNSFVKPNNKLATD